MNSHSGGATELIPLTCTADGVQAVMGRDLHAFLELETGYRHWFPRMVDYGFVAGQDYAVKNDRVHDSLGRERERSNHILSLDMAKELSMIQRTERGKQARQYFLECERRAKRPALLEGKELIARALIEADSTIKQLEADNLAQAAQLEAAAPKVAYHDTYVAPEMDLIQFRTVANQLGIGEQKLRALLVEHRWIYNDVTHRWSNKRGALVKESRWRAMADKKRYFRLVPQHEAPRINGEVRQTLKLTPAGAEAVARMVSRWLGDERRTGSRGGGVGRGA